MLQRKIQYNINECAIDKNPYTIAQYDNDLVNNINYINRLKESKCITMETLYNNNKNNDKFNNRSKDLGYGYTIQSYPNYEHYYDGCVLLQDNNNDTRDILVMIILIFVIIYVVMSGCCELY